MGVAPASGWSWAFSVPQRPSKGPEPRSSRASRVDGNVPSLSSGTARPLMSGKQGRGGESSERGEEAGRRRKAARRTRRDAAGNEDEDPRKSHVLFCGQQGSRGGGRTTAEERKECDLRAAACSDPGRYPGRPARVSSRGQLVPTHGGQGRAFLPRPPRSLFPRTRFRSGPPAPAGSAPPRRRPEPRPQSGAVHTGVAGRAQESSDRTSASLSSGSPPTRGQKAEAASVR